MGFFAKLFKRNTGETMEFTVTADEADGSRVINTYTGDVHDVEDLEGIGPSFTKKLAGVGVHTSLQLEYHTADELAELIGTQPKRVATWQAMADLAKVNGIGMQYAEGLARAGILGIDALLAGEAKDLAVQVNAYMAKLKTNVLGQKITARRITTWQNNADGMQKTNVTISLGADALTTDVKVGTTKQTRAKAPATTKGGRKQVVEAGFKLFVKNGRYSFQKMNQVDAKAKGYKPVYEIPAGYAIEAGANKPLLRKN